MDILEEGKGDLLAWHDPDEQRQWVQKNKSRSLDDKRMEIKEAVSKFVHDGDYLAMGGFGHVRVSMAAIYEMIRQDKSGMTMSGKTAVHDIDVLAAAGCLSAVEVAYCFGHELRGLSPASRRAVESGKLRVAAEISNAGFQWRYKAAAIFKYSSAKKVRDPFSGKPITLLPACYPDIVFIHVHRCDKFGNCQIDGTLIEDFELARAAKRLVITTEKVVDTKVIRKEPWRTSIPFFIVDAVVEVPYGSHPGNMPTLYYSDEEHMAEWLKLTKTDEGVKQYFDKYVHSVDDFKQYIKLIGGKKKMAYLKELEHLKVPLRAPWREK
jgi:acyl CoA:acetate/3-ketoacid CoA transferase alpha subunit